MTTEMFKVYVLLSKKDSKFYIGFTENLEKRLERHFHGKIQATKSRLPLELVFFEAYRNKYDALRREKYLKSTKGKRTLRLMLQEFLTNRGLINS